MVQSKDKDLLEYEKTVVDRIRVDTGHPEDLKLFKELLMKEIEESKYLNEVLQRRLEKQNQMLQIFDIRIEFNENLCLKQGDVEDLRGLI